MIVYYSGSGFMFREPAEAEDLYSCSVMMTFFEIRGGMKDQPRRFGRILADRALESPRIDSKGPELGWGRNTNCAVIGH